MPKTQVVRVRCGTKERRLFQAAASLKGVNLSQLIRDAAINYSLEILKTHEHAN